MEYTKNGLLNEDGTITLQANTLVHTANEELAQKYKTMSYGKNAFLNEDGSISKISVSGGGGVTEHNELTGRESPNCHSVGAITGLEEELGHMLRSENILEGDNITLNKTASEVTINAVIPTSEPIYSFDSNHSMDILLVQGELTYLDTIDLGIHDNTDIVINSLRFKIRAKQELGWVDSPVNLVLHNETLDIWFELGELYLKENTEGTFELDRLSSLIMNPSHVYKLYGTQIGAGESRIKNVHVVGQEQGTRNGLISSFIDVCGSLKLTNDVVLETDYNIQYDEIDLTGCRYDDGEITLAPGVYDLQAVHSVLKSDTGSEGTLLMSVEVNGNREKDMYRIAKVSETGVFDIETKTESLVLRLQTESKIKVYVENIGTGELTLKGDAYNNPSVLYINSRR